MAKPIGWVYKYEDCLKKNVLNFDDFGLRSPRRSEKNILAEQNAPSIAEHLRDVRQGVSYTCVGVGRLYAVRNEQPISL